MPAAPDTPAADLASIIKADVHARRLRDMARARLEKALAEKRETEQQLHRLDIDLRQMRARQGALAQELEDGRSRTAARPMLAAPVAVAVAQGMLPGAPHDDILDDERRLLRERARALDALRQGSRDLQAQLADAEAVERGLRGTLALIRERAQASRTELEHLQDQEDARQRELERARAAAVEIDAAIADTARRAATAGEVLERETGALAALEAQTAGARRRLAEATAARHAAEMEATQAEAAVMAARQRLDERRDALALAERMQQQLDTREAELARMAAARREAESALEQGRAALEELRAATAEMQSQHAADQTAHADISQALAEQRAALAGDGAALTALSPQRARLQADIDAQTADIERLEAARQSMATRIAQARSANAEEAELAAAIAAEIAARDAIRQDIDRVRAEAATLATALNHDTATKARLAGDAERLREEISSRQADIGRLRAALDSAQGSARDLRLAQARSEAANAQGAASASAPEGRTADAGNSPPAAGFPAAPASKPRFSVRAVAVAGAFALAAAGIYLVPSRWQFRTTASPVPPQAPPAAPASAPHANGPIYPPDEGGNPRLQFSHELGERPPASRQGTGKP